MRVHYTFASPLATPRHTRPILIDSEYDKKKKKKKKKVVVVKLVSRHGNSGSGSSSSSIPLLGVALLEAL